jgi:hypothetical protein
MDNQSPILLGMPFSKEDAAMDAWADYPRVPVKDLPRTPLALRSAPHPARIGRGDAPTRRWDQCPRCCASAAAPLVSTRQPGGVIAHHWQCARCESAWDTVFQPLLV